MLFIPWGMVSYIVFAWLKLPKLLCFASTLPIPSELNVLQFWTQVAERALYIWNNQQFVKMASLAVGEVFPVVIEGMEKNLKWHRSKRVRQLTENVKVALEEMDPIFYSECLWRN